MKTKIQDGKTVGSRISKMLTSAATMATELHEIMVQCALHAYVHGDTGLIKRLVLEVRDNPDVKLKGSAVINAPGMAYWFATFCGISERNGEFKLPDKDSDSYAKYVENNTKQFGEPEPGEQRSGNRAFWITAGEDHPFWDMFDVKRQQRSVIRPFGIKTVIENVVRLNTQFDKAVKEGLIPETSKAGAQELIDQLTKLAKDYRSAHSAQILEEEDALKELKETYGVTSDEDEELEEPEVTDTEVGGDVTSGVVEPDVTQPEAGTGTEG